MRHEEILQAILAILAIDGKLDLQELEFFDAMCLELGLSLEKRADLLDEVTQGKGQILIPEDLEERNALLLYLLQAAFANGELALQEHRILRSAAHKMGLEEVLNAQMEGAFAFQAK